MAVKGVEITLGSEWVNRDGDVVTVVQHSHLQRECWEVKGERNGLHFYHYVCNDGRCSARSPEICGGDLMYPYVNEVPIPATTPAPMTVSGYETLANVLHRAYDQAAVGKGVQRHAAAGEPFHKQVMQIGAAKFGVGALLFQAFKKSEESQRLDHERGVAELLGAICYLAGAVIAMETEQAARGVK